MVSADGYPGVYSYVAIDTSPDSVTGPRAELESTSALLPCMSSRAIVFRIAHFHGRPITLARMFVDGRMVLRLRGRSLRTVRLAGLPGSQMHRVRLYEYTRTGLARRVTRRVRGCA